MAAISPSPLRPWLCGHGSWGDGDGFRLVMSHSDSAGDIELVERICREDAASEKVAKKTPAPAQPGSD